MADGDVDDLDTGSEALKVAVDELDEDLADFQLELAEDSFKRDVIRKLTKDDKEKLRAAFPCSVIKD